MNSGNDCFWTVAFSWVVLVCLTFGTTLAQSGAAERRYRTGIRFIQQGNYGKGKVLLTPLINRPTGGISPYAHYYYALADFRQKRFTEAQLMLRQLIDRFPDWKKLDEANYLLAATYLENGHYEDGLASLSRITGSEMKTDVNKLETTYFSRLDDLKRLKRLQQGYPDNRNLALALISLIQQTSTEKSDLELSDRLTNRFGVPAAVGVSRVAQSVVKKRRIHLNRNKGYFNVAVLFPFRVNDLDPEQRIRSNQYVLDLYNGMGLAKNKLQSEGITVNMFAYDIDNDTSRMTSLLTNLGFSQSDILFGPLYAEPNRMASEYANLNEIPLINPISTSSELVMNRPFSFLAMPSLNQQASRAAHYALSLPVPKKAAVYCGNAKRDSILAAIYVNELQKAGVQIIDKRKITGDFGLIPLSEATKPGHVFLASSDEKDGIKLMQVLTHRQLDVPVIATSSAFDFENTSLSVFSKRELYLIYPEYTNSQRPQVDEFEELYIDTHNIIPSMYAYLGYDMLLFFGRALARQRGYLGNRDQLRATSDEGYLLSGYDYTSSNENGVVPIIKLDENGLIQVK